MPCSKRTAGFSEQAVLLLRTICSKVTMCTQTRFCFFQALSFCILFSFLKFLHRSLHVGPLKRLLSRTVLSCRIQGAAGGRGNTDYIQTLFFLWPHRLSNQPDSSQASEDISFTRGGLRGLAGVLAQSVPLQNMTSVFPSHVLLAFPLITPKLHRITIFSFFQYFSTYLPPPSLFPHQSLFFALSVASSSTSLHCYISAFI